MLVYVNIATVKMNKSIPTGFKPIYEIATLLMNQC